MIFQFTAKWTGTHACINVKAGADREHLIESGSVTLSEAEWTQLKRTIEIGAKKTQARVIFETSE